MALNQKLTPILHGRQISKCEAAPDHLTVSFTDGSQLLLQLATSAPQLPEAGRVEKVLETGSRFVLVFSDASQIEMQLSDPGASVSLRDGRGKVEYLG